MKWFKFENQVEENTEEEVSPILVYLSPEALKHTFVVDDFNSFQDTPDCVPGGKFIEVSRQYSFKLRQVEDLVEEPLEEEKLKMQNTSRRNFHEEIKPEKKILKKEEENFDFSTPDSSFNNKPKSEIENNLHEPFDSPEKLNADHVPFEDLESLFVK